MAIKPQPGTDGDDFAAVVEEVMQLTELMTTANKEMDAVIGRLQGTLAVFKVTVDRGGTPRDSDISEALSHIAASVDSVAKRIEEISSVAVAASSVRLAQLARIMQDAVKSAGISPEDSTEDC